ncbi:hypothetical protein OESDEN_14643 [Oesophagostomum dentatum]|uniref:Uncharacterized protein n=1 Tax=Oesophagostomum dentatum TaxID=61180 RepID=A0A0B1SP43_OESDE|nr:hypothetical protein OESDEN_14643 [Oesophagostomum dentatum]
MGVAPPSSTGSRTHSSSNFGSHQQHKKSSKDMEENNNYRNATSERDGSSRHSESSHSQSSQRLRRTESSISSESAVSQKSSGSGSGRGNGHISVGRETAPPPVERRPKQLTPPKKEPKLESLISALLSVGYDLERECPDQLALLKDLIRDAFIDVSEPWARKMILLLLELGASGWKLPAEANEYYFQQTTN